MAYVPYAQYVLAVASLIGAALERSERLRGHIARRSLEHAALDLGDAVVDQTELAVHGGEQFRLAAIRFLACSADSSFCSSIIARSRCSASRRVASASRA